MTTARRITATILTVAALTFGAVAAAPAANASPYDWFCKRYPYLRPLC